MSARISVVIPTWNGRALLAACLDSLASQRVRPAEVVVVDDGSTDGTAEYLAREHAGLRVVQLARNSGFCVAANAGLREARGDLLFLLNNDMTLAPDCIARLAEAADSDDAALFAPLVLFKEQPEVIYSAGDRQCANGRPESIGFRQPRAGFELPARIFGVSGGAALYRRAMLDRVGLLDERYVAYFEDSDLSFRARLAGFEARLVPEAVAWHVGSASLGGKTWWRSRQCFRNHALLVVKNYPARLLARHAGAILRERVLQARHLVSSARCEFGLLRALGMLLAAGCGIWAAAPGCLAARMAVQRNRVIGVDELDALLSREGIERARSGGD